MKLSKNLFTKIAFQYNSSGKITDSCCGIVERGEKGWEVVQKCKTGTPSKPCAHVAGAYLFKSVDFVKIKGKTVKRNPNN